MSQTTSVIVVEKNGSLKSVVVKQFAEGDLYKKAGFKKPDGFEKQTEWKTKLDGVKYLVSLYAKSDGKANTENKYDFPPPVDTTLFFGNCVLVLTTDKDRSEAVSFPLDTWEKIYEKLFGGFEDLTSTALEDEAEVDELLSVPADKKTKHGYLKDGFVVDSSEDDEFADEFADDNTAEDEGDPDSDDADDDECGLFLQDIGSELSEDQYETEEEDDT